MSEKLRNIKSFDNKLQKANFVLLHKIITLRKKVNQYRPYSTKMYSTLGASHFTNN